MNEKNEFLNEERYQKNKKKISRIALIFLIVGLLIGLSLITTGLIKQNKINSSYSFKSKENLQKKLTTEKANLETKKAELETKRFEALTTEKQRLESKKAELISQGVKYNSFAKYDEGESYDLKIITKVLDLSFDNCAFDEYKNNTLTKTYCLLSNYKDEDSKNLNIITEVLDTSFNQCAFQQAKNNPYTSKYCLLKKQLDDKSDFNKNFDSFNSIPFYIVGAFIIIVSCIISSLIYMVSKRREILAFQVQQIMPIAQEGIEKITPTISKAGANIAKEIVPVYGNIAKEISKGIKEGLKEEDENKK